MQRILHPKKSNLFISWAQIFAYNDFAGLHESERRGDDLSLTNTNINISFDGEYANRKPARMVEILIGHVKHLVALIDARTTPELLYLPICYEKEGLAQEVLKFGTDVDSEIVFSDTGIRNAWLDKRPQTSIQTACQYGCSRSLLRDLLNRSKIRLDPGGLGSDLIRWACRNNHSTCQSTVLPLIESGNESEWSLSGRRNGFDDLFLDGQLVSVQSSHRHGGDASAMDDMGCGKRHRACKAQQIHILQSLEIVGLDWNTKGKLTLDENIIRCNPGQFRDVTVLRIAATCKDVRMLEYLFDNDHVSDINQIAYSTEEKANALLVAFESRRPRNVSFLLSKGANIGLPDGPKGRTPLHIAAPLGHEDVVQVLIDYGCDTHAKDNDGLTPELCAYSNDYPEVAAILERHVSEPGTNPPSPVDHALIFRLFTEDGQWNSNSGDGEIKVGQRRPSESLRVAIKIGSLKLCRRLTVGGENIDAGFPSCAGCTPTLYALHHNQLEIAEN